MATSLQLVADNLEWQLFWIFMTNQNTQKLVNAYIHSITYIKRQQRVAEKEAELLVFFFFVVG